jgi:hypothetical protein
VPQKGEVILRQILAVGGEMAPTNQSFTAVIHAWARSGQKEAPQCAEAILQEMEDLSSSNDAFSDTIAVSAVLNTWTKSDQAGAAKRAEAILNHMESMFNDVCAKVKPNVYCYTLFIYCLHMPRWDKRTMQSVSCNDYRLVMTNCD